MIYDTEIGDITKFRIDKDLDGFWMTNFWTTEDKGQVG